MEEISYKVAVTSDPMKTLYAVHFFLTNKKKVTKHICNNKDYWSAELDTGERVICSPPENLPHMNIRISKLWIDKNISEDQIMDLIKNKYIGKKENIVWF